MIPLESKALKVFAPFVKGKTGKLFNIGRKRTYNIVHRYMSRVVDDNRSHPHALRHTYFTHLYQKGEDLVTLKELAGHESISTTQIYTHASSAHLKKVVSRSVEL